MTSNQVVFTTPSVH